MSGWIVNFSGGSFIAWGITKLFAIWGIPPIVGIPLSWITETLIKAPGGNMAEKLMKAPGGNGEMIVRAVFERDPAAYFRNLRK